jgi:hypothetical protein
VGYEEEHPLFGDTCQRCDLSVCWYTDKLINQLFCILEFFYDKLGDKWPQNWEISVSHFRLLLKNQKVSHLHWLEPCRGSAPLLSQFVDSSISSASPVTCAQPVCLGCCHGAWPTPFYWWFKEGSQLPKVTNWVKKNQGIESLLFAWQFHAHSRASWRLCISSVCLACLFFLNPRVICPTCENEEQRWLEEGGVL